MTDVLVCESHWIAAAVSGYLVDSQGKLIVDGKTYVLFRVGIRDDITHPGDEKDDDWREFVFMALGLDGESKKAWLPEPGPDVAPSAAGEAADRTLAYEYLLGRDDFESLPLRYRILPR